MAASTTIPIRQIRVDSTLGTTLSRTRTIPSLVRKALIIWLFPRVVHLATSTLDGERLGQLSMEQARDLHAPLNQFYIELRGLLSKIEGEPWIERTMLKSWAKHLRPDVDRLEHIVESLAWGADAELHEFIQSQIEDIHTAV